MNKQQWKNVYGSKYDSDVFLLTRICREVKLTRVVHEGKIESDPYIYHELLSCCWINKHQFSSELKSDPNNGQIQGVIFGPNRK